MDEMSETIKESEIFGHSMRGKNLRGFQIFKSKVQKTTIKYLHHIKSYEKHIWLMFLLIQFNGWMSCLFTHCVLKCEDIMPI